jgi:hypothetical protein
MPIFKWQIQLDLELILACGVDGTCMSPGAKGKRVALCVAMPRNKQYSVERLIGFRLLNSRCCLVGMKVGLKGKVCP